jgi:prepilin-type processing-associated H-X9-DG protein
MLNESPNPKIDLDQIRPSKEWFAHLPPINQWLLGAGGVCLVLGLVCLIGIPILSATGNSVKVAIHPYTAEGKREACIANLQRIGEALNQYRQDNDGKYPPAEYTTNGKRVTWMTLLRERGLDADTFKCPGNRSTRGDGETTGGYAFNPVFFGKTIEIKDGDDTGKMILVADRGDVNDSTLLPPFTGWSEKVSSDDKDSNLAANHSGQVAILYADGHVDTQVVDPQDATTWGGEHLRAAGLESLELQYPLLSRTQTAKAAAFRNQKQKLYQSLEQLYLFQKETRGYKFLGDDVEDRLWLGSHYLYLLGDHRLEKQLNSDVHLHSQELLGQVKDNWQKHQSEFGFSLEYPAAWQVNPETDGKYRTTYFQSESPHVTAVVEIGERSTPTYATVINWTGMEDAQKARYGKQYKRIAMGATILGRHYASTWDFEVRRPNAPKIRKHYIGYSTLWSSVIFSATTPATEWKDWQGNFARMADSFEMSN